MRVAHRHLPRLVTEQLAHRTQRRAARHQPGRKRVAQMVPANVFEFRVLGRRVESSPQGRDGFARVLAVRHRPP